MLPFTEPKHNNIEFGGLHNYLSKMTDARKNRGSNFTPRERNLLVKLAMAKVDIVENKKTDSVSIRKKGLAWMEVAEEFNKHVLMSERTVKQLRNCYENIKRRYKKKMLDKTGTFHVFADGEVATSLDEETENKLMAIINESLTDPSHKIYGSESSNHGDDDEIDGDVMDDRNGLMMLETVTPIVTIVGENEMHVPSPSPSHPKWRERNRRKKLLKAAKSRDSMASLINERRSVLQEKLEMLREKHAKEMLILRMKKDNEEQMVREKHMEEMFILKMKRENEEKMLREKHVEEMLILKIKKENEQQMLKERHAEEMLILKMKKENELLRRKALESQIEFYKTENV